eukprot:scaffold1138_cov128-Cylindrotheca_fusiformis.AAC.20
MKLCLTLFLTFTAGLTSGFSPLQSDGRRASATTLEAHSINSNVVAKACATVAMTSLLWCAPGIMAEQTFSNNLPFPAETSVVANAVEKASGTGSRVNKDADSLLRYGLPIKNKEVRGLQEALETIKYDIGSKRKSAALDGVKKSKRYLSGKTAEKMTKACRSPAVCSDLLTEIDASLEPLSVALKQSQDAFTGSEQERTALDNAYDAQQQATEALTKLEEQMVPEGYETPVPPEYSDLPQLKKRATVEMVLKKGEAGAQFDINGQNYPEARLKMIIDGYTGT